MGVTGDCYDNALAESFFATLECDLLDRRTFRSQEEAHSAVVLPWGTSPPEEYESIVA
jgi:putative transposase